MDLTALTNIFAPSEFAAPAAADAVEEYTDAVVLMLAQGGSGLVSMAAVARYRRQVPSAVTQRIGGPEAFLDAVVKCFASRWLRWATRRRPDGSTVVRPPHVDDELHGVRVWRVLREIAAAEARAGRPDLAEVDAWERAALARRITTIAEPAPTAAELTLLHCLGRGLRDAMADQAGSVSREDAEEALDLAIRRLGLDTSRQPRGL